MLDTRIIPGPEATNQSKNIENRENCMSTFKLEKRLVLIIDGNHKYYYYDCNSARMKDLFGEKHPICDQDQITENAP